MLTEQGDYVDSASTSQDGKSQFSRITEVTLAESRKPKSYMGMEKLSEKIQFLMDRKDVIASRVAKGIGVDRSQFSRWLSGKGEPTPVQLLKLARFLDTSMEYLADDNIEVKALPGSDITPDEREILRFIRVSQLSLDEVMPRLAMSRPPITFGQLSPAELKELQSRLAEQESSQTTRSSRKRDPA